MSSSSTSFPNPTREDDTDGECNHGIPYTFIVHKTGIDILPPTTKKGPTFASFDHGDHIHVIFSARHTNNGSRHLNTILNFLHASFEGSSEAHTTLQLIRFPTRFISYLIRKGLSTFTYCSFVE
jgi:hypothetical protein